MHFLLPPQIPENSSLLCPWQQQRAIPCDLPSFLSAAASMGPHMHTSCSLFHPVSSQDTSLYPHAASSPQVLFIARRPTSNWDPLYTSHLDPSGVGHTFRIYLGLCLIQSFPSQAFSRGTLQVSLTMAPSTV